MIPDEYLAQRVGFTGYRVLNLDLDDVCADYTGALRDFLVRTGRMAADSHPGDEYYSLYENEGWPFATPAGYFEAHRDAELDHLYARMEPLPGVAEALRTLAGEHVYIRIVTHRLFVSGQHRMVVSDTARWLDEQGIPYMSLCFTGLKDSMQATVHIDDSPANITALRQAGQHVVVFDHPYNRRFAGPRMADWSPESTERLLAWFDQWPEGQEETDTETNGNEGKD